MSTRTNDSGILDHLGVAETSEVKPRCPPSRLTSGLMPSYDAILSEGRRTNHRFIGLDGGLSRMSTSRSATRSSATRSCSTQPMGCHSHGARNADARRISNLGDNRAAGRCASGEHPQLIGSPHDDRQSLDAKRPSSRLEAKLRVRTGRPGSRRLLAIGTRRHSTRLSAVIRRQDKARES